MKTSLVNHIKPTDFPRTEAKTAFALKESLARQFNYARQYPPQMRALKVQMEFMLARCNEWEQASEEHKRAMAAQGLSYDEDKSPRLIMSGGGIREMQAQRAVTIHPKTGEKHVPVMHVTPEVVHTGDTTTPAFQSPVPHAAAATVNNSMGHGYIAIGMESGTTRVDATGKVSEMQLEQQPSAGATNTAQVISQQMAAADQNPAMAEAFAQNVQPQGIRLPPPA